MKGMSRRTRADMVRVLLGGAGLGVGEACGYV
jgi:hypothetical protein